MSSSFLKPSVTPLTALATRARANPCSARCDSLCRVAISWPSFWSNLILPGTGTRILPLGPCTSIASSAIWTFTPAGSGIGFLPIRDMALPNLAQKFAAHAFFPGGLAGHDSARRGKNRDAHAADDGANGALANVTAAAGTRYALQIRQHAALVAGVAEKDAQHLVLVLVDDFVRRDVAFFLQHARNLNFQFRRRQIHARMARAHGVADAREHVSNRVGGHLFSIFLATIFLPLFSLPTGLGHAGDFALERESAEADAAHLEFPQERARPAADPAAVADANLVLQFLLHFGASCRGRHRLSFYPFVSLCAMLRAQRNAQQLQQLAAFFIRLGRSGKRDVHALDFVDARVINLRKHQLILETERVISAPVE